MNPTLTSMIYRSDEKDRFFDGVDYHHMDAQGQEFNENGVCIYKGTFKEGERHGQGQEFNENGVCIYKGTFKEGERHGQGQEFNADGVCIFEGEFRSGRQWNEETIELERRLAAEREAISRRARQDWERQQQRVDEARAQKERDQQNAYDAYNNYMAPYRPGGRGF
jgi:hypothetical protein